MSNVEEDSDHAVSVVNDRMMGTISTNSETSYNLFQFKNLAKRMIPPNYQIVSHFIDLSILDVIQVS